MKNLFLPIGLQIKTLYNKKTNNQNQNQNQNQIGGGIKRNLINKKIIQYNNLKTKKDIINFDIPLNSEPSVFNSFMIKNI